MLIIHEKSEGYDLFVHLNIFDHKTISIADCSG